MSRTNQQTSKLFLEGAVTSVKRLAQPGDEGPNLDHLRYTQELARFILGNLGVRLEERQTAEKNQGIHRKEGLEGLLALLGIENVAPILQKHQVNDEEGLALLTEEDLVAIGIELGPRRKLLNYGHSMRRSQKPQKMQRKPPDSSPRGNPCLVCYDAGECIPPCVYVYLITF